MASVEWAVDVVALEVAVTSKHARRITQHKVRQCKSKVQAT